MSFKTNKQPSHDVSYTELYLKSSNNLLILCGRVCGDVVFGIFSWKLTQNKLMLASLLMQVNYNSQTREKYI